MAQELGTGYIIISPSTKGLGKAIEGSIDEGATAGTKKSSSTILQRVGGAFGKVGKIGLAATTAIGGAVAGLAAKGGFDRALAIERAQTKLKALGHDTKSIDGIMNDALASVKGTAFGLGDAASVAAQLVAAGVKQGGELEGVLKTVGDTAQVAGVEFTQMGTIFGKVAATGKLQGDEMLQLMEAGIPVLSYLAEHFDVTAAEAQKMVSEGKVSFADFEAAMREHLGGAAKSAGNSFDGAMANIKAALSRVGEGFGTPLIKGATQLANQLIPVVDQIASAFKPLQQQFGTAFASAVDAAGAHIDAFARKLESGEVTIQSLTTQLGLLAGGFAVLAGVGGNIDPLINTINLFADSADSAVAKVAGAFKTVPDKISGMLSSGRAAITRFQGLFNKDIEELLSIDGDAFTLGTQRIREGMSGIHAQLANGAEKLGNTQLGGKVGRVFDHMKNGIGSGVANVKSAITGKMAGLAFAFENNPVVASVKTVGSKISSGFSAMGGAITSSLSGLGGRVKGAFAPLGEAFAGLGSMVAGPLQSGFNAIGGAIASFFNPANFMKFVGIGAIVAALVAGLGMLNESTNGQLANWAASLATKIPEVINQISTFITGSLPGLMASGAEIILAIVNAITANLPSLMAVAGMTVQTLLTGLGEAVPQLLPAGVLMITTLLTSIIDQLPLIMQGGLSLLQGLVDGIIAALPVLIAAIPQLIDSFVTTIVTMLPMILETGMQLITSLIEGIVANIPALVAMLPTIIDNTVTTLVSNLPRILQTGIQLLQRLIDGIVQAIPSLVAAVPQIIASIVSTLVSNLPRILQTGVQIIGQLAAGLIQAIPRVVAAIPSIVAGIKSGFTSVNWGSIGMNIINGIKNGITSMAGSLWEAAKNVAKSALDAAKSFLHINSPSRVFRDQVGKMIGAGMAIGIEATQPDVAKAGRELAEESLPKRITLPQFDMDEYRAQAAKTGGYAMDWPSTSTHEETTYNIVINRQQVDADKQLLALLDQLVQAVGVSVRAR